MKMVKSTSRVNVIYFTPKDHKGNVFVIDLVTSAITSSTHSTVVTTDFTVVSAFDCQKKPANDKITMEYIDCVFATHGPFIFRVQLQEDPGVGLVEVTNSPLKGKYEMYFDNYALDIRFNDEFFIIMAKSVKSGDNSYLIYRFLDKFGSNYLWYGLDLEKISYNDPKNMDMALTPTNDFIFLSNSFEDSNKPTFSKITTLKEAELEVLSTSFSELQAERIKFNDGQDNIEQSYVPLAKFFLHADEQNGLFGEKTLTWWHWALLLSTAAVVYGYLVWSWKREQDRRRRIREEILCNNLDDRIKL
jgi:hypothetical protein